jgi:large subunit ribosomal protein L23
MAIFNKKKSSDTADNIAEKEDVKKEGKSTEVKAGAEVSVQNVPMSLLGPRISEKASHLVAQNKYIFNVRKNSNKVEIKKAVERAYKVKVIQVNIVNTQGKSKHSGKISGRTSGFKKAIVTLRKGDKIAGMTDIT